MFERWKLGSAEERPFEPAKLQFGGEGSEGNGAAMRIAPIAIFAYNDWKKAAEVKGEITAHKYANLRCRLLRDARG